MRSKIFSKILVLFLFFQIKSISQSTNKTHNLKKVDKIAKLIEEKEKKQNDLSIKKNKYDKTISKVINWYDNASSYSPKIETLVTLRLNDIIALNEDKAKKIINLNIIIDEKQGVYKGNSLEFSKFSNLEYLKINNKYSNKNITIDLNGLTFLKTLDLNELNSLLILPINFKSLENLENLILNIPKETKTFPLEIFELKKIKLLEISYRLNYNDEHYLTEIPGEIENLINLKSLRINGHLGLTDKISKLINLKELYLNNGSFYSPFKIIYNLPELEILEADIVYDTSFEGIENLKKLKIFSTNHSSINKSLSKIPNLEGLLLRGEMYSDNFPEEFKKLDNLKVLSLRNFQLLTDAPNFIPFLTNLEYLEIINCTNLINFDHNYKNLKNISKIELKYNDKINKIPSNLKHLKNKINIVNFN